MGECHGGGRDIHSERPPAGLHGSLDESSRPASEIEDPASCARQDVAVDGVRGASVPRHLQAGRPRTPCPGAELVQAHVSLWVAQGELVGVVGGETEGAVSWPREEG